MNNTALSKLLNTALKKKYPNQIDGIKVFVEELGKDLYYTHVYVVLNKYDDLNYAKEIREYIEDISKYSGMKINQISFTEKQSYY